MMLLIGVAAFAPLAALTWRVEAAAIPYIVASALLELGYFAFLAAAYRASDVGLVYPVARGSAPVLALAGAVLVMGRPTSAGQIAGVVAVALGILLVCGIGVTDASSDRRGVLLALVTAVFIAGYTLVDKEGLEHAAAIPYIELVLVGPALVYGVVVLRWKGAAALRGEATARLTAVAVLLTATYVLVLLALREAPAASVSAVRETSVVIATVLAALAAHERLRTSRVAGATLVAAGVALVALAGA
jgi:drug/metabolite transporter (DMT)-like permease